MPSDIRIIHAHEFIKATPDGRLDVEETTRLLVEIASASAPSNDYDVLIDTRTAHSELTVADLLDLVARLSKYRKVFARKTAILVPVGRFDHAAFLAGRAQLDGFDANAFISLGDAMAWLVGVGDEEALRTNGVSAGGASASLM